jgi:hypothetical protein
MEHFAIAIERVVPDPFPMPLQKDAELSEHLNTQVEVLSNTVSDILRLYRPLICFRFNNYGRNLQLKPQSSILYARCLNLPGELEVAARYGVWWHA